MGLFCQHRFCKVVMSIDTDNFYIVKCETCGKEIKLKKKPGEKFRHGDIVKGK